jgi:hypothetical protein
VNRYADLIQSGIKVAVFENGIKIDEGEVFQVGNKGPHGNKRVLLVSTFADKGEIKTLFFGDGGWLVLFPDPMTDLLCFSPSGPMYDIRPA